MTGDDLARFLALRPGPATALRWRGGTLSYARLADRVQELSTALVRAGAAGSNVLVLGPLCPAYVVGLLACLRAGAVAVPVDAGLTAARYAWTERAARPSVVLSSDVSPSSHWRGCHEADEVLLDAASGHIVLRCPARRDRRDIARYGDPRAGYLIPTSGSTGTPKAVVGSRDGLYAFLSWFTEQFGLGPDDSCAALTRVNFDPSLRELLSVLSTGGTVRLPAPDTQLDLAALAAHVASGRTTTLFLVPSLARRLADALRAASLRPAGLRRAFFAGEVLPGRVVEQWQELAPGAEFVNLYGLTEGTLAQLCRRRVRPRDADLVRGVPVGRPRPGVRVSVEGGGDGGPGEVLITSARPALGTLTAPAEGAEGPDGAGPSAGPPVLHIAPMPATLHTGDLGVLTAQGELSIAGRIGNDLKVAGRRVSYHRFVAETELLPGVDQCVVVDRGGPHAFVAGPRLCAADDLSAADGPGGADGLGEVDRPGEADGPGGADRPGGEDRCEPVRAVARRLGLPVPVVHLRRELPLLRSGKVDRPALAAAVGEAAGKPRPAAGTASSVTEVLLGILGLGAEVTAATAFVDAGVSSLEMMRFALEVNGRYGLSLTPSDCYDLRDTAALARTVEGARAAPAAPRAPAAPQARPAQAAAGRSDRVPLSTRQLAYMSLCMPGGNANWCNLSREVWIARPLGRAEVERALTGLIARHDALRLRLSADGSHQIHSEPADVVCPLTVHDGPPGAEHRARVQRARVEAVSPLIDVTSAPPLRAVLVASRHESSVLLVGHHLFVDGLGMDRLAGELREHLPGERPPGERPLGGHLPGGHVGEPAAQPPPADGYRAYCRATRRTGEPGPAAEHWRDLLKGVGQTRLPQAAGPGADAGMLLSRPLGVVASRAAHHVAADAGVSVFAVLLAAYARAVATVYALPSPPVVVPVQLREQAPAGTVGMFTSQLVVRGTGPDPRLAARAREFAGQLDAGAAAGAWEFDQRVEELGIEPGGHFPLSTVLFNQHPRRRGLRVRDLGQWQPRPLGRSLRYQLQGEVQVSAAETAVTYYYRRGITMADTTAIDRVHAALLAALREGDGEHGAH